MTTRRVVLLVDGDNIGASHAPRLLAEAARLGRLDVARVYVSSNHQTEWNTAPGFRKMASGCGKNAADLLLCIDAMDLALMQGHDTFALASSDGDFSHLALRLREGGCHVLGLGAAKAPPSFRAACSDFIEIADPKATVPPAPATEPAPASDLDRRIREMIGTHSKNGSGMRITALSVEMSKLHGIKISTYPERTWRAYLTARPKQFALDPKGAEASVRCLPKSATKPASAAP